MIMDTIANDRIYRNRFSACPGQSSRTRAFTLAEVMVATVIFTITSLALTASFIQNQRFTTALSYRTQAVNISMGMVEQIRQISYPDMQAICYKVAGATSAANTPTTINVVIMDPANISTDTTIAPNYRQIQLPINQLTFSVPIKDSSGNTVSSVSNNNWYTTSVPIDLSPSAPSMPIRWWLAIDYNIQTGTTACDAFEIVLIYQWQVPGTKSPPWQSGTIRLVCPDNVTA
jgi:type II secretory pathway pseudopilin PulG